MPSPSQSASRVVCVLGMHRSGTSMLARIVNLLGVSLGPAAHLTGPNAANARGFWENFRMVDLSNRRLGRCGGSWDEPPAVPDRWEVSPELEPVRRAATQVSGQELSAAALWGWKDPRAGIRFPFWQQLVPAMQYV